MARARLSGSTAHKGLYALTVLPTRLLLVDETSSFAAPGKHPRVLAFLVVRVAQDDWRRRGQEQYLRNARLTLKRYQALTAQWEHEHCEFCWHKFLDAEYSESHRKALEADPDRNSAEGYTNLGDDSQPPGKWWICRRCFADFEAEFGWEVVETDPNAWPYSPPEPTPRPTAADYTPPGEWLQRPQ